MNLDKYYLKNFDYLKEFKNIIFIDKVDQPFLIKKINKIYDNQTLIIIGDLELKNKKLIYKLVNKFNLNFFNWNILEFKEKRISHEKTFRIIEEAFLSIIDSSPLDSLQKIYNNDDVSLPLKKDLMEHINHYYMTNYLIRKLEVYNKIVFLNSTEWRNVDQILAKIDKNDNFKNDLIFQSKIFDLIVKISTKIKFSLILISLPFWFITRLKKIKFNKNISYPLIAARTYSTSIGLKENALRLDWFNDGININQNNIIFVAETSLSFKQKGEFSTNNYLLYDLSPNGKLENLFIGTIVNMLLKLYFIYIPLLLVNIFKGSFLYSKSIVAAIFNFVRWKSFISTINPKYYLSYHNHTSDHIYRNIILNDIGCLCYMYKQTNSENLFYNDTEMFDNNIIYAFMKYDKEFHWSLSSEQMAKLNKNLSKEINIIGPLWNPLVKKNNQVENILSANFKNKKNKIMSIFPSTFGYNVVNPINAHLELLKFIHNILYSKKYSNYNIIFKSKTPFQSYLDSDCQNLVEIAKDIKNSSNILFLDNEISASYVIYYSNICICMPFSSPGVEAIMKNRKSFYFDTINSFPNSFFDKIPNFIAHSVENAEYLINFWDKKDANYLNQYKNKYFSKEFNFKSNVDSFKIIRDLINN